MNTDTLQLIGQVILIGLGPVLAKHGISLGNADLDKLLGSVSLLAGIVWKFWHWNVTPSAPAASQPAAVPINRIVSVLALTAALFLFWGCAHLQPGADPIVVNVERFETTAKPTFDLALNVDNSNRAFFATNAPQFHHLCEWLRQPQTVEQTNTLPRAAAMLVSLDDVKLAYKAGRASSNEVFTVLTTAQSAVNQASSWLTVVTNQTH
jgi:hypothetical protein